MIELVNHHSSQLPVHHKPIGCEYYLIHPFELKIERNILNEIIYYDNKQINYIINSEYNYLMLELSTQNKLLNIDYKNIKSRWFSDFKSEHNKFQNNN